MQMRARGRDYSALKDATIGTLIGKERSKHVKCTRVRGSRLVIAARSVYKADLWGGRLGYGAGGRPLGMPWGPPGCMGGSVPNIDSALAGAGACPLKTSSRSLYTFSAEPFKCSIFLKR